MSDILGKIADGIAVEGMEAFASVLADRMELLLDHVPLGGVLRVPLTTVGWSRRDQGRHAAELLLNGLDLEADEPQRIIIPPRLIVRESSGAQP